MIHVERNFLELRDLKNLKVNLINVGENGGQEVPHLHFHIFGGEKVGKMVS